MYSLKLLKEFARISVAKDMIFRINFITNFITDFIYIFLKVLFIEVLFFNVQSINGLDNNEFLILFGTSFIINSIYMTFIFFNHINISSYVKSGEMDYVITKPISSQFYLSFRNFNFSGLSNLIYGVAIILYSLDKINHSFSLINIVTYIFTLIIGFFIYYSLSTILFSISFWTLSNGALLDIFIDVSDAMKYPVSIFPKAIECLFTFIIPLFFIVSLPTDLLLGKVNFYYVFISFFIGVVFFILSKLFFEFSIKNYRSASS